MVPAELTSYSQAKYAEAKHIQTAIKAWVIPQYNTGKQFILYAFIAHTVPDT
jgi:hypothetical protein